MIMLHKLTENTQAWTETTELPDLGGKNAAN